MDQPATANSSKIAWTKRVSWTTHLAPLRRIDGVSGVLVLDEAGGLAAALVKGKLSQDQIRQASDAVHQLVSVITLHRTKLKQLRLDFAGGRLLVRRVDRVWLIVKTAPDADVQAVNEGLAPICEKLRSAIAGLS